VRASVVFVLILAVTAHLTAAPVIKGDTHAGISTGGSRHQGIIATAHHAYFWYNVALTCSGTAAGCRRASMRGRAG